MNRISYDGGPFHGELQQAILSGINFEIRDMCRRVKVRARRIYEVVIVGNATMRDLIFGFDVQPIGEKPYKSVTELEMLAGQRSTTALNVRARDLGLRVFPQANVYGGPLISSHVGADVAADMLAIGLDEEDEVVLLVDVGTNTEVVVGNRHRMIAASCPAGPAFEGGQVTYGMPGYDGAVESVNIGEHGVDCKTIGGAPAQGICGSGLVDLLAELRRCGKMNELGAYENGDDTFVFARKTACSYHAPISVPWHRPSLPISRASTLPCVVTGCRWATSGSSIWRAALPTTSTSKTPSTSDSSPICPRNEWSRWVTRPWKAPPSCSSTAISGNVWNFWRLRSNTSNWRPRRISSTSS